mgnify:CR=1 FL=1
MPCCFDALSARIGEEFHDIDDIRYLLRYLNLSVSGPCDLSELRTRSTRMILDERARHAGKLPGGLSAQTPGAGS